MGVTSEPEGGALSCVKAEMPRGTETEGARGQRDGQEGCKPNRSWQRV